MKTYNIVVFIKEAVQAWIMIGRENNRNGGLFVSLDAYVRVEKPRLLLKTIFVLFSLARTRVSSSVSNRAYRGFSPRSLQTVGSVTEGNTAFEWALLSYCALRLKDMYEDVEIIHELVLWNCGIL